MYLRSTTIHLINLGQRYLAVYNKISFLICPHTKKKEIKAIIVLLIYINLAWMLAA